MVINYLNITSGLTSYCVNESDFSDEIHGVNSLSIRAPLQFVLMTLPSNGTGYSSN